MLQMLKFKKIFAHVSNSSLNPACNISWSGLGLQYKLIFNFDEPVSILKTQVLVNW